MRNKISSFALRSFLSLSLLLALPAAAECPSSSGTGPALPASNGSVWYASPSGTANGFSSSSPMSLSTAISKVQPGETVILMPGSYGSVSFGKSGTSTAPITLRAQTRAATVGSGSFSAAPSDSRSSITVKLTGSKYVRVDGIYGDVSMNSIGYVEIQNIYCYSVSARCISVVHGNNVMIHDNLMQNFAAATSGETGRYHTDYGVFLYGSVSAPLNIVNVFNNYFDGTFNHMLSTKQNVFNVNVTGNTFVDCGWLCLDLGQELDNKSSGSSIDRTSKTIVVTKNVFKVVHSTYNTGRTAISIVNQADAHIEENTITNFPYPIVVTYYTSPYTLTQTGLKSIFASIKNNNFSGGQLIMRGRGYLLDSVELGGNSPISCALRSMTMSGTWSPYPETLSPPKMTYLDSSIKCQ